MHTKPTLFFILVALGSLNACNPQRDSTATSAPASPPATIEPAAKQMHSSWDADNDGINDCEKDGSCDHSIDYTQPRPVPSCHHADGSIEQLVCTTPELAVLANHLATTYSAASKKAVNEQATLLQAEQHGWLKGRDECWKSDDKKQCVKTEYERRISELQAVYQLVEHSGPIHFECNSSTTGQLTVTFYQSDIPTLIANYGDSTSLMYSAIAASGAKYIGRNESFWEHQGEARVVWGYNTPEFVCKKAE